MLYFPKKKAKPFLIVHLGLFWSTELFDTLQILLFINKYDYRINGTIVANLFNSICQNCNNRNKKFIVNEDKSHTVPREIFQEAAYWIDR